MKNLKTKILSVLLSVAMLASMTATVIPASAANGYSTTITSMETNSLEDATTVDDTTPRFSWAMDSNLIGQKQTAYQIRVTNVETGEEVWNSGKVEDSNSTWVEYPGTATPLQPKTAYEWVVTVWDKNGTPVVSEPEQFTTGLMSEDLSTWEGAEWIGADELYLDAASMPVYRMNYTMRIKQGGEKSGFVFGADDPRFSATIYNNYLIHGENYIAYQLNVSQMPATVEVYRVGYCSTDTVETPIATIEVPETIINDKNKNGFHDYEIVISGNQMESMSIDGQKISDALTLNPGGTELYPRLNSIGFITSENNQKATDFSNISIKNYREPQAEVFGKDTGATYDIFEGIKGVTVKEDGSILVNKGMLAYADPSYGSIPMLRKDFTADKEIERATVYATARGIYEMSINGQRVGDEYFTPGNSDYRQQIQYTSYDVTKLLQKGENTIGATLASGWYGDEASFNLTDYNFYGDHQSFLAMMEIKYTDGTSSIVKTDDTWQYYGEGPVRYAGNFNGETYDANLEAAVAGWDTPDYDASAWRAATVMDSKVSGYEPKIVAKTDEGVKQVETLDATFVSKETRGDDNHTVYIYDMGTNMVGVPQITLPEGEAGQEITLRFGESIYPDLPENNEYNYGDLAGLILTENYRTALSTDRYTMKGAEGGETFVPEFTFHGYRYIEISGVDEQIPEENIKGIVLSSITEQTSNFDSSNELVNQLFENIMRSTYGNHLSIATDCPQRDERLGWSGDAQVFSRTATYMADMNSFYGNFLSLMRDAQGKQDGTYDKYAPSYNAVVGNAMNLGYCWQAAGVVVPYETYLQYGDTSIITEHYDSMKLHMDGMMSKKAAGKEYLTSNTGFLADHLSVASTDTPMLSNATFYYVTKAMADMAAAIGETEDAQLYSDYAAGIKAEWNATYVDPETHKTTASGKVQDTQASYSLPLAYDVFDETNKPYAEDYLVEACARENYTITTGFVGTAPLLPALTEGGNIEDAYKMLEQTEYASWLYPVTQGATSIWERWNSYTVENGYGGNNGMNSFNHYSLGAVGAWMMGYQVGIQRDDTAGFQSFELQPTPGGSFTYTNGSYESDYGTIVSNWTADQGELTSYEAVVPANTTATLYLPVSEEAVADFTAIDGITYVGMEEHNGQMTAKFNLEAGGYNFSLQDGKLVASIADGYVADETETADKGILNSVIEYADAAKASGEYDNAIESVQKSFDEALTNAKAVAENDAATQEEVDAAWQTLLNEIHKLGFVAGDKTELASLIAAAEEIDLSKYVEAGQAEFTTALEAAQSVYKDGDAMQTEINEVADNLLNAMLNLRYKADKSILEEVVAKANQIDANAYTAESYAVLEAALKDANAVLANENATQEEVDAAVTNVQSAMDSLVAVEGTETETPTTDNNATQTGQESTTTKANAAKTGDIAPIAGIAVLAVAGAALFLFSRKK
ncbi:family 78 glycoside hydrolase catalytic domain [Massilioclostridium coli]|uniref:family 78 glycoside hydrolase catalytic domain n=1 Tax=Massilioclostridium coli TaxID=1870991 RepID=UPI00085C8B32|nr:family 78 glycoside hydrolase catalytic domain [Massilioclostridium coli]